MGIYTAKVEIVRMICDSFPAFVECVLVDCHGKKHYFHDKISVFSLDYDTEVPKTGEMRCRIVQVGQDSLIIDTLLPDAIESTDGEHRFEIDRGEQWETGFPLRNGFTSC